MKKDSLKKIFTILALAAGAVMPVFAEDKPAPEKPVTAEPSQDEITYWKTEFFDAVLALRKCKEQIVCAEVHWVNPKDDKIFDYWADPKMKKWSMDGETRKASEEEVRSVCGYKPKMQFSQVAPNKWRGTIDMRGIGMKVNTNVTIINDQEMRVVTSKAFFTETETWRRVEANDPRYPRCEAPKIK